MFKLTQNEISYTAVSIEGFFYGIYSGIFATYLIQYQASKKDTNKPQNIIQCYFMCALYALSVSSFICDIATTLYRSLGKPPDSLSLHLFLIGTTSFACCDFIAQLILIYRCWIVWGRNICVVIIPSILAFAFLGTWLTYNYTTTISPHVLLAPGWGTPVVLTSIALSLTVNALVTGLIVFRIFKVFREVKAALEDQILGATSGSKLRYVIFILIESGMALFSVQLIRIVVTIVKTDAASTAMTIIVSIHKMLNGITPTIIVVRTAMGLSFEDEKSMEDVAIASLHSAPDHLISVPEMGIIGIDQDRRDDDDTIT